MHVTENENELVYLEFKSSCNNPNLSDREIEDILDELPIYNLDSLLNYFNIIEETRPQLFERMKENLLK
jgi:hypothetical protein